MVFKFIAICCLIAQIYGQMVSQELVIYDGTTEQNSEFYIWTTNNEPDLLGYTSLNMTNDLAHYICRLGGVTAYTGVNFTGTVYSIPYSTTHSCWSVEPGVKSTRFNGLLDDALASTLTFYSDTSFIGEQFIIDANTTTISYSFASIYKTGDQSWTLFTGVDYSGFSLCMSTNVVVDISSLGVEPGEIQSARMGC